MSTRTPSDLRKLIDASSNVVAFTGAGISTDSGLPDFRGPDGIWTNSPESEKVFDIAHFKSDVEIRRRYWASRLNVLGVKPNGGHMALARLYNLGKLSAVVTQNIDGLHQASRIPDFAIHELHGSLSGVTCMSCGTGMPMTSFLASTSDPATAPCGDCGGVMKPDIVMFGETLSQVVFNRAERAICGSDLVLVLGSSLSVYPAAGLIAAAQHDGIPTAIVNNSYTSYDYDATLVVRRDVSATLDLAVPYPQAGRERPPFGV